MAMQRMDLMKDVRVLEISREATEMAAILISQNIIHENGLSDAIHISVATMPEWIFLSYGTEAYCESLCSKSTSKGRGRLRFCIACHLHTGGIFKR
jgi:hypothetical protein